MVCPLRLRKYTRVNSFSHVGAESVKCRAQAYVFQNVSDPHKIVCDTIPLYFFSFFSLIIMSCIESTCTHIQFSWIVDKKLF